MSDTLSGLATDYPKIRYGWNSTASMGSWLNMNYSIQNDYYYDTSLFNWYQYSGETLYVQILMQDKCGNTDTKTYTQYINIAPPLSIKITAPDTYLHDTYTQIITVSGTTLNSTAGDTIIIYTYSNSTLTPNTSTILTSINGNWSGTALLNGYGDSIVVKITDIFGRIAYDTISLNYFKTPSITILSPNTATDTIIPRISLVCRIQESASPDTVQVLVNSQVQYTYTVSTFNETPTFTNKILLNGYGDSILVILHDRFGRITTDTITINLLGRVKNVRATNRATGGAVRLQWDKINDANFSAYKIYYSTKPFVNVDNATLYATITNVNTVDTIVYGLTNEQLYYFAVTYTSSSGLEFKDIYKYEAEYGNFIGNAYMTNIASNYSGRGYVAGLDNNAGTVAINVICGADNTGSYILGIIGSVGSATNKSIKVRVNSSASDTTLTTTNYNNWDTAYITATLNEGVNTITISAIDGNDTPNIDAVVLTSTGRPQATPTGVYAFAISAETEVIKNDTFNFVIQALDERSETLTSFVGTVILYDTKNILSPDSTTAINITTNGNTTVICSLSELGFDTIIVWNAAFGVAAQFVIEVIEATFYDTSVVINEIMFDPPVAIGNPDGDWLELYN
ncbi:MAG TPA: hypothetical protein PLJ38_07235, partial [bacterium]|nr:hypothetical protein [bacterium]